MSSRISIFFILIYILFLLTGCKKKDSPKEEALQQNKPLAVVTGTPSNITYYSAEFSPVISSNGPDPITDLGICWDNSTGPTISKNKISGIGVSNFTAVISDLKDDKDYFVRAYATSAAGTVYGEEMHFSAPGNWIASGTGLQGKLSCMTSLGGGLFAGTENDGIFYMDLATEQWTADESLGVKNIRALIPYFDIQSFIYAATSQGIFYFYGGTWAPKNDGLEDLNTTTLVNSSLILFTVAKGNVYKLRQGFAWTKLSYPGIVANIWNTSKGVIAFDKASGNIFHIDLEGNIGTLLASPSPDVLAIAEFKGMLYLGASEGAYVSSDNGVSWVKVNDANVEGHTVSTFMEDRTGLCAAVGNDVYKARPSGNWLRVCPGIPQTNSQVQRLAYDGEIYAYVANTFSSQLYRLD